MEQSRWCGSPKSTDELSQGHQSSGRGLNLVAPKREAGLLVIQMQSSNSSAWCVAASGPSVCWLVRTRQQTDRAAQCQYETGNLHVACSPSWRIYPESRRQPRS